MAKAKNLKLDDRQNRMQEIIRLIVQVADHILKAGEKYVALIDEDPGAKDAMLEWCQRENLAINRQFLNRLEQVGRHQLHWRLCSAWKEGHSSQIRQLPFSEQKEIFEADKKYPLLLPNGDNVMVNVQTVPKEQAAQLFDNGSIRDLAEQKLWLLENNKSGDFDEVKEPWVIGKGYVDIEPHDKKLRVTRAKIQEWLLGM